MKKVSISLLALSVALSGCSKSTPGIPVNLATAQAEAAAITTAIDTESALLIPALPAASQVIAKREVANLDAAEKILATVAPPGTVALSGMSMQIALRDVAAFNSDVAPIIALLPLPLPTQAAIQAGLLILSALENGIAIIIPAPAPTSNVGATAVVPAPIPIPL